MAYAVQERGNVVAEGVPEGLGEEGNALQGWLVVEFLPRNERERGGKLLFSRKTVLDDIKKSIDLLQEQGNIANGNLAESNQRCSPMFRVTYAFKQIIKTSESREF